MASDPDDNPFARPSVWPRMPQAPMSIRTLSGAERSEPEPPPATITPLFVRPMDAPPSAGLPSGAGVPASRPKVAPAIPVAPITPRQPDSPAQVDAETQTLLVAPARTRLPKARSWRVPAIAAAVVGLAGLAGLAFLLGRGGAKMPLPSVAVSAVAEPVTAALPTSVPQLAASTRPAPAAEVGAVVQPAARSVVPRPATSILQRPAAIPESEASIATSEALAGAVVALPVPIARPIYRPPPAVDPASPVVTRDPNS